MSQRIPVSDLQDLSERDILILTAQQANYLAEQMDGIKTDVTQTKVEVRNLKNVLMRLPCRPLFNPGKPQSPEECPDEDVLRSRFVRSGVAYLLFKLKRHRKKSAAVAILVVALTLGMKLGFPGF